MSNPQNSFNGYQVPQGMMLVPMPQQQVQVQPIVSQYKPSNVTHSNSFKHNKVAPPPPSPQKIQKPGKTNDRKEYVE